MVTQVISSIIEALSAFLAGLGGAIIDFFDGVFIVVGEAGAIQLTNFGLLALALFGIGIAFTVVTWVFRLIKVR